MRVQGVRGATTVSRNDRTEILAATEELLHKLIELNGIRAEDLVSALFSVTADLNAEFPAVAARAPGIAWTEVALLNAVEIDVPGSLRRCIRVLLHWNTAKTQGEVRHAFLHGARSLRPLWAIDLPGDPPREA
ncbi:MAG: chorismate mutase [Chloroflexi bacterium]|nr:chorismate mutase [Chloroflexota bacterium]